jgi:hypothetical protein
MIAAAGPRVCEGAVLVSGHLQRHNVSAQMTSPGRSHRTLNRLAGALTQCARSRFRQLRLALLPICSTFEDGLSKIDMALSRNVLTPPPAHGECCHSSLGRLSVAVARGTIRSTSTGFFGRGVGLEDVADNSTGANTS